MKKIISTLLAVTLVIGMMLTLASCGVKQPKASKGYDLYENDDLSFAYPQEWDMEKGSITLIYDPITGNNINIVYEENTDEYENLTAKEFTDLMQTSLVGISGSIINVYEKKYETVNAEVDTFTYSVKLGENISYQTMIIATIEERIYLITVTSPTKKEMESYVQTILDTFYVKDNRTFFEKVSDTIKEKINK